MCKVYVFECEGPDHSQEKIENFMRWWQSETSIIIVHQKDWNVWSAQTCSLDHDCYQALHDRGVFVTIERGEHIHFPFYKWDLTIYYQYATKTIQVEDYRKFY